MKVPSELLGRLLETADAGDVLVAAEVSRLARSTLQVLELLQAAAERGLTVHIAKHRMVLDQSLPATIRGSAQIGVEIQHKDRLLTDPGTIEDVLAVENDVVPFDRADVLEQGCATAFLGDSPRSPRPRDLLGLPIGFETERSWPGVDKNGRINRRYMTRQ